MEHTSVKFHVQGNLRVEHHIVRKFKTAWYLNAATFATFHPEQNIVLGIQDKEQMSQLAKIHE